jgi:putative membrane protein
MPFSAAISTYRIPFLKNWWLKIFLVAFLAVWIDSFIGTSDYSNWMLENLLVVIFFIVLLWSYRRYQFSDLSFLLITIYLILHVYGSKYTYAENPLGYWLKDQFNWERNHYDRIVHFSFGFLLAYPMRELFLKWLRFPRWVAWILPIEITLSIGSLYELIEWSVAGIFFPEQGMAYLGTQGDIWDAQKDIALAVFGAALATTIVSSIKKLGRIYSVEELNEMKSKE